MKSPGAPKIPRTATAVKPCCAGDPSPEIWPPEILVVEDGSSVLPIIGAMLQCWGFQVILAPDVSTALQQMWHDQIAAVITGVSRQEERGLDLLDAVKEMRADVKTLVVTHLINPGLPVRAYEMDIDDYLHWPLSGSELSKRLRGLLGQAGPANSHRCIDPGVAGHQLSPAAVAGVLDGCSELLGQISRAVNSITRKHHEDMPGALRDDLQRLTGLIHTMSRLLCQSPQPAAGTPPPAAPRQFH